MRKDLIIEKLTRISLKAFLFQKLGTGHSKLYFLIFYSDTILRKRPELFSCSAFQALPLTPLEQNQNEEVVSVLF